MKDFGLDNKNCERTPGELKQTIGRPAIPEPVALSIENLPRKCTTGSSVLDKCLKGGIPTGNITEIVGESTAGKTQLCLQLALNCQLPVRRGGLGGRSLIIYTEGRFPFQRLKEMAKEFETSSQSKPDERCPEFNLEVKCLEGIFIEQVYSLEELMCYLRWKLPLQLKHQERTAPVKLIIIDSIANLIRSEFDTNKEELTHRSSAMFQISSLLRRYSDEHNLAVVVTNQTVDHMGGFNSGMSKGLQVGNYTMLLSSQRIVSPALGLSWANCVNSRVFLSRVKPPFSGDFESKATEGILSGKRKLQVVFSPFLPPSSASYFITRSGICGIEDG